MNGGAHLRGRVKRNGEVIIRCNPDGTWTRTPSFALTVVNTKTGRVVCYDDMNGLDRAVTECLQMVEDARTAWRRGFTRKSLK